MYEDEVYINSFDVNEMLGKARFFLGDRWVVVGDLVTTYSKMGCTIELPDVEEFLEKREFLDDGTFDWVEWGPRVN